MERFKVFALIGVFLSLVSLCLPWASVRAMFGLGFEIYGFTTDGVFSFIFILIAFALMFGGWRKWKPILSIIFSIMALLFVIEVFANTNRLIGVKEGVMVSYGPGIFLMTVACLITICGAFMMPRRPSESKTSFSADSPIFKSLWLK